MTGKKILTIEEVMARAATEQRQCAPEKDEVMCPLKALDVLKEMLSKTGGDQDRNGRETLRGMRPPL